MALSAPPKQSALIDPHSLASRLQNTTVLDASWYMPHVQRDPHADFQAKRIPGALYFDIDAPGLSDDSSSYPHMVPKPEQFEAAVAQLAVTHDKPVVIYAQSGFLGAARAWWTFRLHGKTDVFLLDGGLQEWEKQNLPLDTSAPSSKPSLPTGKPFTARVNPNMLLTMQDMLSQIQQRNGIIIDSRSKGRFDGTAPEPRPGLSSGHMPTAFSVPGSAVMDSGKLKSLPELRKAFQMAGIDLEAIPQPISLTCGSGVSASILCLALHELGLHAAIYDGSWSEYGAHKNNPVENL